MPPPLHVRLCIKYQKWCYFCTFAKCIVICMIWVRIFFLWAAVIPSSLATNRASILVWAGILSATTTQCKAFFLTTFGQKCMVIFFIWVDIFFLCAACITLVNVEPARYYHLSIAVKNNNAKHFTHGASFLLGQMSNMQLYYSVDGLSLTFFTKIPLPWTPSSSHLTIFSLTRQAPILLVRTIPCFIQ
jgi:hypothetical protein